MLEQLADSFRRSVDAGELPGVALVVSIGGEVVLDVVDGWRDIEREAPMTADTVVRIYSMSKAVTSAVVLSLVDEGRLSLDDAVADYLPELGRASVLAGVENGRPVTRPARHAMRVRHLLSHTSGLVSGFDPDSPVDADYRAASLQVPQDFDADLATFCATLASIPLAFDPGTSWRYGVSSDVAGRVAEVAGGASLDELVRNRLTAPLGMASTGFAVAPGDAERFAACYGPVPGNRLALLDDPQTSRFLRPRRLHAGGSGLVSSVPDFHRFTLALLGDGELDGTRILSVEAARTLRSNLLPAGRDLAGTGMPAFHGLDGHGTGFACGGAVVLGPGGPPGMGRGAPQGGARLAGGPGQPRPGPGSYFWGGVASTEFVVDPQRRLAAVLATQLQPSFARPTRAQLWRLFGELPDRS